MFFRPWKGATLAGTTETEYTGDPARVKPTTNEIADILSTYNHYFPDTPCSGADITQTFCGLRVLPQTRGTPFSASRETIILSDNPESPGYLAIYGGKLTTYRKESEKVLKLIMRNIEPPVSRSTRDIALE
jgi:glycerol-3-phosphate dehydrogenase